MNIEHFSTATPKILIQALRQYQHNDCSGFLAGFDYDETIRIVSGLQKRVRDNTDPYKRLYTVVNNLMEEVGCEGQVEINTYSNIVCKLMGALYDIDGGKFDNEKYGYIKKQLADNSEEDG